MTQTFIFLEQKDFKNQHATLGAHSKPAANIGFGVIGAGRCYLQLQQHGGSCSGLTEYYLAFCCYLHHQFFNRALVPGGRFPNPPTTPSPARCVLL